MARGRKSVKGRMVSVTCLLAGSLCLAGGTPSWGGGPPNNDVSDAAGNTAGGTKALVTNTTGVNNTATGFAALKSNTMGKRNTALGESALLGNITGDYNTATGSHALEKNTTGFRNTATGLDALLLNYTGNYNTAVGSDALEFNTDGSGNTALGWNALHFSGDGDNNTAMGRGALQQLTDGVNNLALGANAGNNLTEGSNNIYLGHEGVDGESDTLRLGSTQTRAFVAGVVSTPVVGSTVLIDSNGQLGTLVSSTRFKEDIQPIGARSQQLQQLRPVTFRYKQLPQGPVQYGLIAEEVAKVYPELVTRNAKEEIEGIRYEELTPMLLNELQHQQQTQTRQQREIATQKSQNAHQEQEIVGLKAENKNLQAALVQQNAALAARVEQLEAGAHLATVASR